MQRKSITTLHFKKGNWARWREGVMHAVLSSISMYSPDSDRDGSRIRQMKTLLIFYNLELYSDYRGRSEVTGQKYSLAIPKWRDNLRK